LTVGSGPTGAEGEEEARARRRQGSVLGVRGCDH
jgi:hypothetical protein